jgi:hypothetical protein
MTYQSIPASHVCGGLCFPGKSRPHLRNLWLQLIVNQPWTQYQKCYQKRYGGGLNILHIENIRNRIERLDETCKDIVDDMRLANHDQKNNIPESYITRLAQMEKELTGRDTSICSGICDLQNLRFGFVPRDTPKRSSTSGKQATKKRKRDSGNCGAHHLRGGE